MKSAYATISVERLDKGKPCGEGFISADKKCRGGEGGSSDPADTKATEAEAKKKAEIAKGQWVLAATILGLYAVAAIADVAVTEEVRGQWRKQYNRYYDSYRSSWNNAYGNPPKEEKKPEWWDTLGVNKNATPDDIRKAYKKKAREFHPDINKDPEAEEMMKAINDAFDRSGRRRDSLFISATDLDGFGVLLTGIQKKKVESKVYARI